MRRDFKIKAFSTYTNKYCFAYIICLTCGTEIGRTIANATIKNTREKQVGDIVKSSCYACKKAEEDAFRELLMGYYGIKIK
jgi:hypothetical protein